MTIEQHCRDLLELAIAEDLVALPDRNDPHPQCRSAGELIGLANALAAILRREHGTPDPAPRARKTPSPPAPA